MSKYQQYIQDVISEACKFVAETAAIMLDGKDQEIDSLRQQNEKMKKALLLAKTCAYRSGALAGISDVDVREVQWHLFREIDFALSEHDKANGSVSNG